MAWEGSGALKDLLQHKKWLAGWRLSGVLVAACDVPVGVCVHCDSSAHTLVNIEAACQRVPRPEEIPAKRTAVTALVCPLCALPCVALPPK